MIAAALAQELAARLDAAERDRIQIDLFSRAYPDMDVADGYAVQRAWIALKLASGRRVIGHKIGLTSRAMQMASNIDEPDHGVLLDDMLIRDGSDIACDRFIVPRIEVELAFILRHDLRGPHCTIFDVLAATEYVVPALEIIDARIFQIDPQTRQTRTVIDTISDNAANAGIILGGRPVPPDATDLRWVSALLSRNGVIEETGVAAGVLNHPANGVAWLCNKLAPHGAGLERRHVVLSGSFTRPVFVRPGDTIHADYGPLGAIACRFV